MRQSDCATVAQIVTDTTAEPLAKLLPLCHVANALCHCGPAISLSVILYEHPKPARQDVEIDSKRTISCRKYLHQSDFSLLIIFVHHSRFGIIISNFERHEVLC